VAGPNFGCGSAREQAATTLKFAGVGAILADSFARAFYRNAINNALPVLSLPGISALVREGDDLEVDLETGLIRDRTNGGEWSAAPNPPFVLGIIRAGGAIPYYSRLIKEGRNA
jgi:3-isopropylmalate/(R)-2-methylmalate dehydratase small subunit